MTFKTLYNSISGALGLNCSKKIVHLQSSSSFLDASIKMNDDLLSRLEKLTPEILENNPRTAYELRTSIDSWNDAVVKKYF